MTSRHWLPMFFDLTSRQQRPTQKGPRHWRRPRLEALEDRLAPANIFSVNNGDVTTLIADIKQANTETGDIINLATNGTYTFTRAADYWYGPDALPAIASTMTINGNGATLMRSGTAPFRFFYVASGNSTTSPGLGAGNLTLNNLTLTGGLAHGGMGGSGDGGGGGGAGLGGAIFDQGTLALHQVTFSTNTAQGGAGGASNSSYGAGGGGGLGGNGGNATNFGGAGGGGFAANGGNAPYLGGAGGGGFAGNGGNASVEGGAGGGGRTAAGGNSTHLDGANGGGPNAGSGGTSGNPTGNPGTSGGQDSGGGGGGDGNTDNATTAQGGKGGDGGPFGGGGGGGDASVGLDSPQETRGIGGEGGAGGFGGGGGGGGGGDGGPNQGGNGGAGNIGGGGGGSADFLDLYPTSAGLGGYGGGGGAGNRSETGAAGGFGGGRGGDGFHGGAAGSGFGGALFVAANASATLDTLTFSGNAALAGPGGTAIFGSSYVGTAGTGKGGAIFVDSGVTLTVTGTLTLSGNSATTSDSDVFGVNITTTMLTSNSPTVYGATAKLTAIVRRVVNPTPAGSLAAGTVEFDNGSTKLGTGALALVNGQYQATYSTTSLNAGTYTNLTARYLGTAILNGSTSSAIMHVVNPAMLIITANDATKTYGQTVTFMGTEFTTSVLLNGNTVTSVMLTSAGAAATAAVANSPYAITPSGAVGTGLSNYSISYVTGKLTVNPASLTVTAKDASKTYGQTVTFMGTEFTTSVLLNSDTVTSVMLTSAGAGATATVAGSPYGIVPSAAVGTGLSNYTIGYANGKLTVTPATLTITAKDASRIYGVANPAFSVSYSSFVLGEDPSVLGGTLSFSTPAVACSAPGLYVITASGLTSSNYNLTFKSGTLTVTAAPLTATAQTITPTAGAPFSGVVATFTNADPFGGVNSYTATITWGDGNSSAGTITDQGGGIFAVSGSHTYADPNNYAVQVLIQHKLGYTSSASTSGIATVTRLSIGVQRGQSASIYFWAGLSGQTLINSFNGGPGATGLANWLALSFPNLYGAQAGAHNLFGKTNAQVAVFFQTLLPLNVLDAEVLATALNVYATTRSLGGTAAQAYGFSVTALGLGANSFSVSASGVAFGVANYSTLNVYQMLLAVNRRAVNGVLCNGDPSLRIQAQLVFDALNFAGGVG